MRFCITGASSGLGKELARACVRAGHDVYAVARREELLRSLGQELGSHFSWMVADISKEDDVLRWAQDMAKKNFVPDVLVLNASVQMSDMSDQGMHLAAAEGTIDVNIAAQIRCITALVPSMLARADGTVVAVASTAMLRPSSISASYSASKAAIHLLMRSLDLRYRSRGVRFKTVCLGPIATEMWEGKRSWLVPSPTRAAHAILRFASSWRSVLYFPFLTTAILRATLWLPDAVFARVSAVVMK
jgi:short-subunit dehydrogenase